MSEEERKFIKETVKEKPVNKKRIAIRFMISALSGVIFAVVACGMIALLLPRWTDINGLRNTSAVDPGGVDHTGDLDTPEINDTTGSDFNTDFAAPLGTDNGTDKNQEKDSGDTGEQTSSADIYSEAVAEIYEAGARADRSVVKVTGVTSGLDLFNSPYENGKAGCGLIVEINDEGVLIVAESRLIDDSSHISIEFYDGMTAEAIEYASDDVTGLSIMLVPATNFDNEYLEKCKAADLGVTFSPRIGQELLAIGAPQGKIHGIIRGNVTASGEQISASDANYTYFLTNINKTAETEGYICNQKGEIVGFIIDKFANEMSRDYICAIAVSEIKSTIDKLVAGEHMPYVGVLFNVVTEKISSDYYIPRGIYIKETVLDSPAMEAGLMPGDIITNIAGEEVNTEALFEKVVRNLVPGRRVDFTIRRQSVEGYVELHYELTPSTKR